MTAPVQVGTGRWAVPGNRWELLADRTGASSAVSVVIPYYENQHDLDLVLGALAGQTHPAHLLQVVVADDGSATAPRVDRAGLEVFTVRQQDLGFRAGAARNLGAARTDGEVLLFLDGDTVPDPEYVARMSRLPALLPDAVVGGCRLHADLTGVVPDRLAAMWSDPDYRVQGEPEWLAAEYRRSGNLRRLHPRSWKYLIGAVLGCSRMLFDELGGFDESIVGYGGEDYDLTYRAYNAGAVLAYVPQAKAWHDGPDWTDRTDPQARTGLKNREILMLAERIPEPSMRGSGQIYPVPDVVITLDPAGWPLGAAVSCLRSLLVAMDCGIWCPEPSPATAAFAGDPRLHTGPVPAATTARARAQLILTRPVIASGSFGELVVDMLERDIGTLLVGAHSDPDPDPGDVDPLLGELVDPTSGSVAPGSTTTHPRHTPTDAALMETDLVMTVRTTRELRRSRRWAQSTPAGGWFGTQTRSPAEAGVSLLPADLSLAGLFGGWVSTY